MLGYSPAEVAAISWILELPRDLGLPNDMTAAIANNIEMWPGWEGRYADAPDWPGEPPDAAPRKRLRFRRALVGIGMPTESTDRTFGDLKGLTGFARMRHERGLRRLVREGVKEWKTVCQMTHWYVNESIPVPTPGDDPMDLESALHRGFPELLDDLDLWLQGYGLISGKMDVGSIALHDLPALIPWVLHMKAGPDQDPPFIGSGMLAIHSRTPDLLSGEANENAAEGATRLFAGGAGVYPFFTAFSTLFQAQAHGLAGRGRQAVIDSGTAVESFVAELINEVMVTRGHSEAEVQELLRKRWTDIYNRELLSLLNIPNGQGGRAHSGWWARDYDLRIRAVHRGYRATQEEGLRAVSDTWDVFDWIGERVRAQPDIAAIGQAIRIQRRN